MPSFNDPFRYTDRVAVVTVGKRIGLAVAVHCRAGARVALLAINPAVHAVRPFASWRPGLHGGIALISPSPDVGRPCFGA